MDKNIIPDFLNKFINIQFIVQFLLSKILNKTLDILYKLIGNNLNGLVDEKFLEYKDIAVSILLLIVIFFLYR
jgi:hypothetical protein